MDQDVESFYKKCFGCTVVSKTDPPIPMIRTNLPEAPWQQLAIDFLCVPELKVSLLVIVDYYSRFIIVEEMRLTNAETTIMTLEANFIKWSYPVSIKADNGPPFDSKQFRDYCVSRNIRLVHSIPYWPQMNGEVERQNRGLVRCLKIAKAEKKTPWRSALTEYVSTYNMRPHSVTNKAPLEVMTGRPVKGLLPSLKHNKFQEEEGVRERDTIAKLKGKLYADHRRHATESNIQKGDKVLMLRTKPSSKLDANFETQPCIVTDIKDGDVLVKNNEGTQYRRNVSHLKKVPVTDENETEEPVNQEEDKMTEDRQKSMDTEKDAETLEEESAMQMDISPEESCTRPKRKIKVPQRFAD